RPREAVRTLNEIGVSRQPRRSDETPQYLKPAQAALPRQIGKRDRRRSIVVNEAFGLKMALGTDCSLSTRFPHISTGSNINNSSSHCSAVFASSPVRIEKSFRKRSETPGSVTTGRENS